MLYFPSAWNPLCVLINTWFKIWKFKCLLVFGWETKGKEDIILWRLPFSLFLWLERNGRIYGEVWSSRHFFFGSVVEELCFCHLFLILNSKSSFIYLYYYLVIREKFSHPYKQWFHSPLQRVWDLTSTSITRYVVLSSIY